MATKEQPESFPIIIDVKYKLDASSVQTIEKLDIKNFREFLARESDMLTSHKVKVAKAR